MPHLQVTFCTEKQLPSNQHWQAPAGNSTYIPLAARHASFVFASYIPTPSAAIAAPLNKASSISIQRLQSHLLFSPQMQSSHVAKIEKLKFLACR